MYRYFIAAMIVNANDRMSFQVIRVSPEFKLEFSLMTESEILDLVKQGAIVVGLNKKSSYGHSLNYEKYSGRLKSALLKINPLISKQIPVVESSKNNYKTAIYLKQLNNHLYEAIIVDMFCKVEKVIIDTNKRGYTTLAWNVRYPIIGEKTLEIVGLRTAEQRSKQISEQKREQLKKEAEAQQEEIRKRKLAEQLINKPKKLARFWVVGLNCEIIKPSKGMGDKEYIDEMQKTKFVKWSEKELRVVDLSQKVGDKFKVLNMSYKDVYDLSLYENVGNMQRLELEWFTYSDDEEQPWMGFGIGDKFNERMSMLHNVGRDDMGWTLNDIYEWVVDAKRKEIDIMSVCIDIDEIEDNMYELILLDCYGGIRKIKVNTSGSNRNIISAAEIFNITNICKLESKSSNEIIKRLRESFYGVGKEIKQLGKFVGSCGVCNGIDNYIDIDEEKKNIIATVCFYDKLYKIKINNYSQNMTKEEIENKVKFNILEHRENDVMKYLGIRNNERLKQIYIGLYCKDGDDESGMCGCIIEKA